MAINMENRKRILDLYTDATSPDAFSTLDNFYRSLKDKNLTVSRTSLAQLLRKNVPFVTLNRKPRWRFPRRVFLPSGIDSSWSADLAYFPAEILRSLRCKGFLVVCDNLTLFIFVEPIKSAKAADVANAFEKIITESRRCPKTLITDQGGEFLGLSMTTLLTKYGIRLQTTSQLPNKAALAESSVKRFKTLIKKWMRQNEKKNFKPHLKRLIAILNNVPLRRLAMKSPYEIDVDNAKIPLQYLKRKSENMPPMDNDLERGDIVRVQLPDTFAPGTRAKFSDEKFRINTVLTERRPFLFQLVDAEGTKLRKVCFEGGTFTVVQVCASAGPRSKENRFKTSFGPRMKQIYGGDIIICGKMSEFHLNNEGFFSIPFSHPWPLKSKFMRIIDFQMEKPPAYFKKPFCLLMPHIARDLCVNSLRLPAIFFAGWGRDRATRGPIVEISKLPMGSHAIQFQICQLKEGKCLTNLERPHDFDDARISFVLELYAEF